MSTSLAANISSSLFAFLNFEQLNSHYDIEGLLFGEVTSRVLESISDSRIRSRKKEIYLNIQMIKKLKDKIYDHNGTIIQEKLSEVLKGRRQNVIGWFKCRHNTTLRIAMREKQIHENLSKLLCSESSDLFLFGLFTTSTSSNQAVHSNHFKFFHRVKKNFETIHLSVINLGDTNHAEYKTSENLAICCKNGIVGHLMATDSSEPETVLVDDIYSDVWQGVQYLKESVHQTSQTIASLEAEIDFLRSSLSDPESYQEKKEYVDDTTEQGKPTNQTSDDPFSFISDMKNRMTDDAKKCAVDRQLTSNHGK